MKDQRMTMAVVAVADAADIPRAIEAHTAWRNGQAPSADAPKPLWIPGAATDLGSHSGIVIDLSKLNPETKHLVFFLFPDR